MAKKHAKYEFPKNNRNVAIYARYSSSNQTEQSIEGQLTVCQNYCERNNFVVINEYIDRAISGRSDDRPAFLEMINDAKKHEFAYVLVYKLDRFSRNMYNSAVYKHELSKEGVTLLSAMENIGQGPESILLEAVIEASAEYYSIDLSQKVRRGLQESAKKGKFAGGGVPLGYKLVDGYYTVDEEKAKYVKYIFTEYASGKSKKEIIDEINAMGLRNKRGNPITQSSLQTLLSNKKLIGILDQHGIVKEIPAIIDKELFDMVQARLKENAKRGGKNKASVNYLLSGKLRCGYCGTQMVGVSGNGKSGQTFYYYSCAKKKKKPKDCNKKHERKDFIEDFILDLTIEYVLRPDNLQNIAAAVVAEYKKEFNNSEIKALEKSIRKLDSDANNLADAIAETPAVAQKRLIEKLEATSQELEYQKVELAKLKVANKVELTEKEIAEWLKSFCMQSKDDEEITRKLIDAFINTIYLFDDKIIIYYNIQNTKPVEYETMADDLASAIEDSVRFISEPTEWLVSNTNSLLILHGCICLIAMRN